MKRIPGTLMLLFAAVAVWAVACTSSKGQEATREVIGTETAEAVESGNDDGDGPPDAPTDPTSSPKGVLGPAREQDGGGLTPRITLRGFWPDGAGSITIVGPDGRTSEFFSVEARSVPLPALGPASEVCGQPGTASVELLQDSIIVPGVSVRLVYVAQAAADEELWLIAGHLEGVNAGGGGPVAVWATLGSGGVGLTYENTWAANEAAAEHSSLRGGRGLEATYSQLPGFKDVTQCVSEAREDAWQRLTVPEFVPFTRDLLMPPPVSTHGPFNPAMCRTADLETVWTITESLAEGFTLRGPQMVASRFHDGDDGPALWHVAADIEGPGVEGEGPFAVWIAAITPEGHFFTVTANPVAEHFSSLPSRDSVNGFPDFIDGFSESVSCVAYGLQQGAASAPAAFVPSGCNTPDAAIFDLIAGSLDEPGMSLRAAMMSTPVSTGDGNQTVVVAADIEGFGMEGVGPLAVWVVAVMSDGEFYAISANVAALNNSDLPGPSGVRYVPEDAPGYAEAVACTQMALTGPASGTG